MSDRVVVSPMVPEDLREVVGLMAEGVRDSRFGVEPDEARILFYANEFVRKSDTPAIDDSFGYVARDPDSGSLLGVILGDIATPYYADYYEAMECGFFVTATARGRGVFTSMLDEFQQHCRVRDVRTVYMRINFGAPDRNADVAELLERKGYAVAGYNLARTL